MHGSRGGNWGFWTHSPHTLKNHKTVDLFKDTGMDHPGKLQNCPANILCRAVIGPPAKRFVSGDMLARFVYHIQRSQFSRCVAHLVGAHGIVSFFVKIIKSLYFSFIYEPQH